MLWTEIEYSLFLIKGFVKDCFGVILNLLFF